jgi:hypothetical protein
MRISSPSTLAALPTQTVTAGICTLYWRARGMSSFSNTMEYGDEVCFRS